MANVLKMHEQSNIQQLAAQGWSRKRIARELGVDRKTVRRYLKAAAKSPPISTPGSGEAQSKSPPISTPGDSSSPPGQVVGPEMVAAALEAEAEIGRASCRERVIQ